MVPSGTATAEHIGARKVGEGAGPLPCFVEAFDDGQRLLDWPSDTGSKGW
jgi:hypothetical protein